MFYEEKENLTPFVSEDETPATDAGESQEAGTEEV